MIGLFVFVIVLAAMWLHQAWRTIALENEIFAAKMRAAGEVVEREAQADKLLRRELQIFAMCRLIAERDERIAKDAQTIRLYRQADGRRQARAAQEREIEAGRFAQMSKQQSLMRGMWSVN